MEDVGILREEAEDQPRHEVVHVGPALGGVPVRVLLQQRSIEPVEAARGADVEAALAQLPDGGDPRQRQEEAEMVRKGGVVAGDRLAGLHVLGLERVPVGRQDELGLGLGRCWAGLQPAQRLGDGAGGGDSDMDVVGLKHAAHV